MRISRKGSIILIAAALLSLAAQRNSLAGGATWSTTPVSGNWTTAQNWIPNTVPNGPADSASFATSSQAQLSVTGLIEVAGLNFGSGADAFTITTVPASNLGTVLFISGAGITNVSGQVQTFSTEFNDTFTSGIFFENGATAGEMTDFATEGGLFIFNDSSSAGSASFDVSNTGSFPGELAFNDSSTAAEATITLSNNGSVSFGDSATAADAVISALTGGNVYFGIASRAGNAVITLSGDGYSSFVQSATADHSHFAAGGAGNSSEPGAIINIGDSATAGEATFVLEGGSVAGAPGAELTFFNSGKAGNASITVNGGSNGGRGASVLFQAESDGGTARLALFGNGKVDFSRHSPGLVTVGSVAGDGQMALGAAALAVGSNNQSTTFSGVIEDGEISGGSLSKIGSGTFKLTGANTYSGGTTIKEGALAVRNTTGSATGTGPVQVEGGALAGAGVIAGPVTIGSGSGAGALLAPSQGASRPTTLTLQSSLTFKADASYRYRLNLKKTKSDQVVANGVTIESGAQFDFSALANKRLPRGQVFSAIGNTSAAPISGAFANLADGTTLQAGRNRLQVSYSGGDGNDLTLTVVP